jgi:pteridine reductase
MIESSPPVAWVTGSGSPRVGRSVAEHFANQGYRIALHAHHSTIQAEAFAQELNGRGVDSMVVAGSIESDSFATTSVDRIVDRFGRLDVLVHAAAIWDWKSLEETKAADVQKQFSVNTLGSFLCAQAAGLQMTKQPSGGSIVLIGDWAVHRPYPDFAAYFAGKGAIETLVRTFAIELASRNPSVKVSGILPGPVMLDESISAEKAERILQQSLLKIQGQPSHVATAAYFLATHPFITGVCLPVDGGRSIFAGHATDAIAHPTFS